MERFDVYDNNGRYLNKTILRGVKLPDGEYHKIVHIWIINENNEYLIQQRNKQNDEIPFQWATHGGAVLSKETPVQAAIRETKEEIGLDVSESSLNHLATYTTEHTYNNYITDVYLIQSTISLNSLQIDSSEVKQCKYVTQDKLKQMISKNEFWNYDELIAPNYMRALEMR